MDLEMTGLDIRRHVIVEIATLITDDDLNVVAEGPDLVVHATAEKLADMDDVVRDMHERSGLLAAIEASTLTLEEAGEETLAFLKEHLPDPGAVPRGGNSLGTARRFLAAKLPNVGRPLISGSSNVSTTRGPARRWYPDVLAGAPKKAGGHRALDDI